MVPQVVHPVNDGETAITEFVEKIEGEVALDTYVKAQTSAPEVVKRLTELENSLQRLASAVMTSAISISIRNCALPQTKRSWSSKIRSRSTKISIDSTANWDHLMICESSRTNTEIVFERDSAPTLLSYAA